MSTLSLRIPDSLHRTLKDAAERRGGGDQRAEPEHGERNVNAGERERGRRDVGAGGNELRQERNVEHADLGIEVLVRRPRRNADPC